MKIHFRDASFKYVHAMVIDRAKKSIRIALKCYLLIDLEKEYLNKRKNGSSSSGTIEEKINAYYGMINTLTETIVSISTVQIVIYVP